MTDIKRTRDRSAASTGMGAPSDGMDMANVSMLIRQMQENIEDLSRRIPAIPEPVEETPVDPSIRIDIDRNGMKIGDLLNVLNRLREEVRRLIGLYSAETFNGLPVLSGAGGGFGLGVVWGSGNDKGYYGYFDGAWERLPLSFTTKDSNAPIASLAVISNEGFHKIDNFGNDSDYAGITHIG